jgi:hypothetical protein
MAYSHRVESTRRVVKSFSFEHSATRKTTDTSSDQNYFRFVQVPKKHDVQTLEPDG